MVASDAFKRIRPLLILVGSGGRGEGAAVIFRFLVRLVAAILASLFVVSAILVLVIFTLEQQLFDPGVYKRALVQEHIYERLPSLLASQITDSLQSAGPESQTFQYLSQADFEALLADLVSPDWAQTQTESVIDQSFAYLNSDSPKAKIVISLTEIKARLAGQSGESPLLRIVNSWPPCTTDQELAWAGAVASGSLGQIPACRPPDEVLSQLTPVLDEVTVSLAAQIPDQIDLAATYVYGEQPPGEGSSSAPPPGTNESPGDPRQNLRRIRQVVHLSPLLPLALLLLIAPFAAGSWREFLRWWGIPLLVVGLIGVVLALATMPLVNQLVATYNDWLTANAPAAVVEIALAVVRDVLSGYAVRLRDKAVIISLIGFGLILVTAWRSGSKPQPHHKSHPSPDSSPQSENRS